MIPNVVNAVAEPGVVATMTQEFLGLLGIGLVLPIAAVGSCIAITIVGLAAVGAWKRCIKANKPLPMTIVALTGMPISQTLYAFILLLQMINITPTVENAGLLFGYGIGTGLALFFSAVAQGKIGAAACDALADDSKGFVNYLMVLGIAETVALFAMVFTMINLPG